MSTIDSQPRNERIDLRLTAEVKQLLVRAASYSGMSLSRFLESAASAKAKEVVGEQEAVVLSADDWNAFVSALDDTVTPRPRLEAAARRYLDGRQPD